MTAYSQQIVTESVFRFSLNLYDGHANGGDVAEMIQRAYEDKRARGLDADGVDSVRVVPRDGELWVEYRHDGPLPDEDSTKVRTASRAARTASQDVRWASRDVRTAQAVVVESARTLVEHWGSGSQTRPAAASVTEQLLGELLVAVQRLDDVL